MKNLSNILFGAGIVLSLIGLWQPGLLSNPIAYAECYTDGTFTCSGTNETCPTQPCIRQIGTVEYECNTETGSPVSGTVTENYERKYMSYPHYASVAEGPGRAELKNPENKKCLFEYRCQCKNSPNDESSEQDPYCIGSDQPPTAGNTGTTIETRQPDSSSSLCSGG